MRADFPNQKQCAGLPRCVPGCARCQCPPDHRKYEALRLPRAGGGFFPPRAAAAQRHWYTSAAPNNLASELPTKYSVPQPLTSILSPKNLVGGSRVDFEQPRAFQTGCGSSQGGASSVSAAVPRQEGRRPAPLVAGAGCAVCGRSRTSRPTSRTVRQRPGRTRGIRLARASRRARSRPRSPSGEKNNDDSTFRHDPRMRQSPRSRSAGGPVRGVPSRREAGTVFGARADIQVIGSVSLISLTGICAADLSPR